MHKDQSHNCINDVQATLDEVARLLAELDNEQELVLGEHKMVTE